MVLRKSFYIRWSAGRSPRVHEVNPGRDPSKQVCRKTRKVIRTCLQIKSCVGHNILKTNIALVVVLRE